VAKAKIKVPRLALREALKRAGSFEALRPCLHLGQVPARHGGLYSWPDGRLRSGPGAVRPAWWMHAYQDRAGRMIFFTEPVWSGSAVIEEQVFAYVVSIELDSVAFDAVFPVAARPPLEPEPAPPFPQVEPGLPPEPESVLPAEPRQVELPSPREQPGEPTVGSAADASVPGANTEAPVAEPEPASPPPVDAMTTEPPQAIASEESPDKQLKDPVVGVQASVRAQSVPEQSEMPPPGEQPDEAASTDAKQPDQPQAVASEESPPPREPLGESTVGSAGGEAAPAPAPVGAAPAPVQSMPEVQPKPPPDKQSDEPTDPAALTDFIFRELTAMPQAHFKNGCLLQDLIEYLLVAAQLAKDAVGLPRAELLKFIFEVIARAALARHYTLKGHRDDPSGQACSIPPETLPSFLFDQWERSRLIVDGPGTIWHGVTVWRSEVEAPDTESDLGEPPAPAPVADASTPVANTESLVAEPEAASVDAMTAAAESPPEPATLTVDEDPTDPEPSLANKGGRPPRWDFVAVIPLLETRKAENKPFKDMAAFKSYIQKKVQRVDGLNRGNGPEITTVERAITKHRLDEYAPFQK
jgi:hypothetical protein